MKSQKKLLGILGVLSLPLLMAGSADPGSSEMNHLEDQGFIVTSSVQRSFEEYETWGPVETVYYTERTLERQ